MLLKTLRIALAALCLCCFGILFFLPEIAISLRLDWLAKIQLGPALAGASLATLAIVLAISAIFGRLYCAIICPLGLFQDLFMPAKGNFRYLRIPFWPRLALLTIFVAALATGTMLVFGLLDPYSIFGRLLATARGHVSALSWLALGYLLLLAWLARKYGRLWCNAICPIGAILGGLNKIAPLKIRIDSSACKHCGACVKVCKGACIHMPKAQDGGQPQIAHSRCVTCFNCISACKFGAAGYRIKP